MGTGVTMDDADSDRDNNSEKAASESDGDGAQGPSLRQWLHIVTGDRDREIDALARDAAGGDASPAARNAAESAVHAAHGDLGVSATLEVEGDQATASDVQRHMDGPRSDPPDE